MLQAISISDEDIRYAEQILLPTGKVFDEERRAFIRNLNTIDLQAVPGSGKTTAILAKLIILERNLPLVDGSGILVLSHTNAAIDEIKAKIKQHCPKLFSYPNFVGTIQSFVDEYLAMPLYNNIFFKKLNWIDNETYQNELIKHFNVIAWNTNYDKPTTWFYQRHIARAESESNGNDDLKKQLCKKYIEDEVRGLYFDFIESLIKNKNDDVVLRDSNNKKFIGLKKIIFEVLEKGIISYDYAYHFGETYLNAISGLKEILQKRFSIVFVDEMQDMDVHQYNLLEKIFYDNGNASSIFQRIGDKNQAIYNSVKADDVWTDRGAVLKFTGSQRLSKPIADVVKNFALHADANFDIVGLNQSTIKPYILVFDDANIKNIIPFYVQVIKENGLDNLDKPLKVVCWSADWKDNDVSRQDPKKLRLEDYFSGYKKEKSTPRLDYDSLKSYLIYYDKNKKSLRPLYKNLLNALLKILRLENISAADNRPYTRKKLLDFLKETDAQKYEELNLNLYNWSIGVIQGNAGVIWSQIKVYAPNFLGIFSKTITSASSDFINADVGIQIDENELSQTTNKLLVSGLEIEVSTVHSVKGQTHAATLYLESCYEGKHESERLAKQFLNERFTENKVYHRSSVKMTYVGFSRPTDLLCVAVHKDRFDQYLSGINSSEWEIKVVNSI